MNTSRFLDYEIALMLAQYGRSAVLAALSRKLSLPQAEMEALLSQIETERPRSRHARATRITDPLETVIT